MATKRKPKLEVFGPRYASKTAKAQYYFHLRAANGEIQFPSEGYPTRAHAKRGALTAQRRMAEAELVIVE